MKKIRKPYAQLLLSRKTVRFLSTHTLAVAVAGTAQAAPNQTEACATKVETCVGGHTDTCYPSDAC